MVILEVFADLGPLLLQPGHILNLSDSSIPTPPSRGAGNLVDSLATNWQLPLTLVEQRG